MCSTSATSSHLWDSYRVLVPSLFGRRPQLSPESSTLVSLFLGPIQFHVPCDFQVVLATMFRSPSMSCFRVSLALDVVYCTTNISTLSHWVHTDMYISISSRALVVMILHISISSRALVVMILHSMRMPLFLCIIYSFQFMYSASHWGHHDVLLVVYMYWSDPIIWALIPIFYF